MNWIILLSSAFLCYLIYLLIRSLNENLPPGPWGLPIVGYSPFICSKPEQKFFELSKTYGDVLRINSMGTTIIILNSYEATKECFSTKGDEFSGRLHTKDDMHWFLTDGIGFLREEGVTWREHRHFAVRTLRDFGIGKLSLEAKVQKIGQDLLDFLHNTKGKPTDARNLLTNAIFDVILCLITGKHFQHDDEDFVKIKASIEVYFRALTADFFCFNFKKLFSSRILPNRWKFPVVVKVKDVLDKILEKFLKEHKDTLDERTPRDYMDAFLIERNKALKEGKADETSFTEQRLKANVIQLLFGGTESTALTLYWMLNIVSHRQDIQERLHKELDDVVGRERLPSILDRPSLPYTDAFTLELFRYTTIAPLGTIHSNPARAKLRGYDIPTRSLIYANLWAIHNDPSFWKDPELFDPERFMDPETKAKRREHVIPFAIGKRSCLGESLSRMELFIFMTMLLQQFKFLPEEGDTGDQDQKIARILKPYKVKAVRRS